MSLAKMPPSLPEYRSAAAIIGLGETDNGDDYAAARAKPPGYTPPAPDGLAAVAFERALADAGFDRKEIDGLAVAFLYGGPSVGRLPSRSS